TGTKAGSSDQPLLSEVLIYVPIGYIGTVSEIAMVRGLAANVVTSITATMLAGSNWASDSNSVNPTGGANLLAGSPTPAATMAAGVFGIRWKDAADFAGGVFPTVTGGELIQFTFAVGAGTQTLRGVVAIDLTW